MYNYVGPVVGAAVGVGDGDSVGLSVGASLYNTKNKRHGTNIKQLLLVWLILFSAGTLGWRMERV